MELAYPLCGFLIGSLVGFTGIGGGSVMTPLLIYPDQRFAMPR